MDSEPQPPGSRADADARPRHQQQQQQRAAPSPAPSRRSSLAASTLTPLAERPGDDYFEPLSQAPSQRSRLSTVSVSRFPSLTASESRPVRPEQTRRPSIRIRRSSISSNRGPVTGAAEGPVSSHGGNDDARYQGGRPRSISQPSAAHLPADYVSSARNSRRLPQVALPRLTEEGSRPTMGELGITGSPISPAVSLPERTLSNDGAGGEGAGPARGKPKRLGRVSRMLWPGFGKRDPAQTGAATAESRQDDEYDEELVDWLDIIGKPPRSNPLLLLPLTVPRPRSPNPVDAHQRPKLALHPRPRRLDQPQAHVCALPARLASDQTGICGRAAARPRGRDGRVRGRV